MKNNPALIIWKLLLDSDQMLFFAYNVAYIMANSYYKQKT